jgi:hypothetical protein
MFSGGGFIGVDAFSIYFLDVYATDHCSRSQMIC